MLFIVMWATAIAPKDWKVSDTVLIDKHKGPETDLNSHRPVGLVNTLYKLWTRMITNALYNYAECNSILSYAQAKRLHSSNTKRNHGSEDAKLFKQDIYALIVDSTSAFNTTDHEKLLWIMYDLGFPTDAIDVVKDLYMEAVQKYDYPQNYTQNPFLLKEELCKKTPFPFFFS
jgi:hypothetical protein